MVFSPASATTACGGKSQLRWFGFQIHERSFDTQADLYALSHTSKVHPLACDKDAIAACKIFYPPLAVLYKDFRVAAANVLVLDSDLAFVNTSYAKRLVEEQVYTRRYSSAHVQTRR
jgi:hypothetical protein